MLKGYLIFLLSAIHAHYSFLILGFDVLHKNLLIPRILKKNQIIVLRSPKFLQLMLMFLRLIKVLRSPKFFRLMLMFLRLIKDLGSPKFFRLMLMFLRLMKVIIHDHREAHLYTQFLYLHPLILLF